MGIYNILLYFYCNSRVVWWLNKGKKCNLYTLSTIHYICYRYIPDIIPDRFKYDLNIIPNTSTNNNIHVFDIFKITARLCFNRLQVYFGGINQVMDRKSCLNRLIPNDTSFHYIQSYIGIIAIINIYLYMYMTRAVQFRKHVLQRLLFLFNNLFGVFSLSLSLSSLWKSHIVNGI